MTHRGKQREVEVSNISELVNGLFDNNNGAAYECLKALVIASEEDDGVYRFFDTFADMMDSQNSYIRTRGMLLISANAKWDTDCKIDEIIDKYLCHILDDKPVTARQCIKALPNIAKHKPELVGDIRDALNNASLQRYGDSMRPLVFGDVKAALKRIDGSVSEGSGSA